MFDKYPFTFDAKSIEDFFKTGDFSKQFFAAQMPAVDPQTLIESQKKNMAALVEANKAAAAGYQGLYERQVALFEETMQDAQAQIASLSTENLTPDGASARGEAVQTAFAKALGNMQALAEQAQKANTEAYDLVAARIREQAEEFKATVEKNTSA